MGRGILLGLAVLATVCGQAAERVFDFTTNQVGTLPAGFRSTLAGVGKPGDWQLITDEVPSELPRLSPNAPALSKRMVLAQLSRDPTDERFPLLVFEDETFGDFTLTAKVKMVSGAVEQMAGIAFRIQDEKNFYVVRASSMGNTFRFYRVVNGVRDNPLGPEIEIPKGVWHEISVECRGNRIRLRLNGNQPIPELTDNSFSTGKIGLWTKSDSVSYFSDLRMVYTPREYLAKVIVRETLRRYPRLLGLKIFAPTRKRPELHIIASDNEKDLGQPAGQYEKETVAQDAPFCGKSGSRVTVTMPLHDRNGDPIGAVRVVLQSFPGQTDQNAVARALLIMKTIEPRVRSVHDLTE